jgi:hypothetical protein
MLPFLGAGGVAAQRLANASGGRTSAAAPATLLTTHLTPTATTTLLITAARQPCPKRQLIQTQGQGEFIITVIPWHLTTTPPCCDGGGNTSSWWCEGVTWAQPPSIRAELPRLPRLNLLLLFLVLLAVV